MRRILLSVVFVLSVMIFAGLPGCGSGSSRPTPPDFNPQTASQPEAIANPAAGIKPSRPPGPMGPAPGVPR